MRILRAMAEKNLEVRQGAWRDANEWHQVIGWSKVGVGGVVGVGGAVIGIGNGLDKLVTGKGATGGAVGGLIVAGVGAAVLAWGVIDLLNPPAAPVAEWEIERKVTVTPPSKAGAVQVRVIQEAPAKRE